MRSRVDSHESTRSTVSIPPPHPLIRGAASSPPDPPQQHTLEEALAALAPAAAAAAAALLRAEEVSVEQLRDGIVSDTDLEEAGLAADARAAIAAWRADADRL
jgi:hypothetical protein